MPEPSPVPIKELVLSIQFSPLEKYSSVYGSLFWQERFASWPRVQELPELTDSFEQFDRDKLWFHGFALSPAPTTNRLQIFSADETEIVQIQRSRFARNWIKQPGAQYPGFPHCFEKFQRAFQDFEEFASSRLGSAVEVNQWEITYVDFFRKHEGWDSVENWNRVLPSLFADVSGLKLPLETRSANWSLRFPDDKGRIHLSAKLARDEESELIRLDILARGPAKTREEAIAAMDEGHSAIREVFDWLKGAKTGGEPDA